MEDPNLISFLSGGNHELFHSNLLAYIAIRYPQYFISIFRAECGDCLNGYVYKDVVREKNHFDLAIRNDKKYIFVLENKMKSIPDPAQLSRYREKSEDAIHVLLTMIRVNDEDVDQWHQITYGELAKRMEERLKNQNIDDYFKTFLEDYIRYITYLSQEIENLDFDNPKTIKEALEGGKELNDNSAWEKKYIQKARFQILAEKIKNKFGKLLICNAGIVRGNIPFIDIWPVLEANPGKSKSDQIKEWRKLSNSSHHNQYWCQIYSDHIERGFLVFYDTIPNMYSAKAKNMPKKTKKAKERYPFLEQVWKYCLEVPEFKEIAERLKLNQQFEKNKQKNEHKALLGYIYPDRVMVYVRSEIENEDIESFITSIANELHVVYKILANN